MFFLSACLDSLKRKQMFEMSVSCRVNSVPHPTPRPRSPAIISGIVGGV